MTKPQVKTLTSAAECRFEILSHPPYSPDLAPSDYYLFPKTKYELRRKWFESNNDVMVAADDFLGVQTLALFFEGIAKPEYRGLTCIDVKGD